MDQEFSSSPPSAAVSAAETRSLLKSIRRIARASDLQSRALARTNGLTGPQLVILMAVAELGEVTTKSLADFADLSSATVVTVLENLEQRAIVERYRSGADRRIVYTKLTAKGQQMMSSAPHVFGDAFACRYAELPESERARLVDSIATLADLLSLR